MSRSSQMLLGLIENRPVRSRPISIPRMIENMSEAQVDLERVRDQVERIQKQISDVRARAAKEKQAGKSDSVLKSFTDQMKKLHDQIVQAWKSYDAKHGTRYHLTYA